MYSELLLFVEIAVEQFEIMIYPETCLALLKFYTGEARILLGARIVFQKCCHKIAALCHANSLKMKKPFEYYVLYDETLNAFFEIGIEKNFAKQLLDCIIER